jgi:hypothetical protein
MSICLSGEPGTLSWPGRTCQPWLQSTTRHVRSRQAKTSRRSAQAVRQSRPEIWTESSTYPHVPSSCGAWKRVCRRLKCLVSSVHLQMSRLANASTCTPTSRTQTLIFGEFLGSCLGRVCGQTHIHEERQPRSRQRPSATPCGHMALMAPSISSEDISRWTSGHQPKHDACRGAAPYPDLGFSSLHRIRTQHERANSNMVRT